MEVDEGSSPAEVPQDQPDSIEELRRRVYRLETAVIYLVAILMGLTIGLALFLVMNWQGWLWLG